MGGGLGPPTWFLGGISPADGGALGPGGGCVLVGRGAACNAGECAVKAPEYNGRAGAYRE